MAGRTIFPLILAAAGLALAAPVPAAAEDPPFVGWSALLPGLVVPFEPSSEDDCQAGRTRCVDQVIREMQRRFAPLARGCDHDTIFALSYLLTTQEYRRTIEDATSFDDTPFVNHEDAVFARYYFEAYDAWHGGRAAEVPGAWRIAFDAADRRSVSASGDLLLGINAHVMRDLPFVLAGIGLVKPDGGTRKTDHDRVNAFLNRVTLPLREAIVRRFDPAFDDTDVPTELDATTMFQAVAAWRELAWRNAERLASAGSLAERARVAEEIERAATTQAVLLRTALAYGPLQGSGARDAFCASNIGR
jgi:hypothetical protein